MLYSQQGFKSQLQFTDANGNNLNKNSSVNFNYDYLAIPFKLGYSFGEKFKFTPRIGVCSSFLLSAKTESPTIDNNGNQVGTEKVDVKKNVSKFDLSGLLDLEAGYVFTPKMELFALLTCKRSFTTFSNENYFKDLNMKHYGFSIGFGLKYKINQ